MGCSAVSSLYANQISDHAMRVRDCPHVEQDSSVGMPACVERCALRTQPPTAAMRPQELYAPAPQLWLRPQRAAPAADASTTSRYACPLYRTHERRGVLATTGHSTNFIMLVPLPSRHPPKHWTLRGACLLCQRPE